MNPLSTKQKKKNSQMRTKGSKDVNLTNENINFRGFCVIISVFYKKYIRHNEMMTRNGHLSAFYYPKNSIFVGIYKKEEKVNFLLS